MRDIGRRLSRYRLRRYAPVGADTPAALRRRWVWALVGVWVLWVAVLSEHSLWRLWQLGRENAHGQVELRRAQAEAEQLNRALDDPLARRLQAEKVLRENMSMTRHGEIIYRIDDDPPPRH